MEPLKCNLKEVEEFNERVKRALLKGAPADKKVFIVLWNGKRVGGEGDKLTTGIKTPLSLKEELKGSLNPYQFMTKRIGQYQSLLLIKVNSFKRGTTLLEER